MRMKKVMVTGAAGFIGSHLTEALLKKGIEVVAVDDLSAGTLLNLEPLRYLGKLNIVPMDILGLKTGDFYGIDVIFHQAASKKTVCLKNPLRDLDVNAGGTLHLLRRAKIAGVKKFVHASTGSVNGLRKEVPVSHYGISKLAAEKYVNLYSEDVDTTILRYYHVYGSRQESADEVGGVIAIWLRRLKEKKPLIVYGDGEQQRLFTHVSDVVRANLWVVEHDIKGTYNILYGEPWSLNEVLRLFKRYTPLQVSYAPEVEGDIRRFLINDNLIRDLGFEYRISPEEGITDLLKNAVYGETL